MPKVAKKERSSGAPCHRPSNSLDKQSTIGTTRIKPPAMGPGSKKGDYDKRLLVTLVLKSAKDIQWESLGSRIGKTAVQCKDVWRKVIHPALISNKAWNVCGKDWTADMKLQTLMTVLDAVKPDWEGMTVAFPGKSKSQIHDVWRKVVLPRLKRGGSVE
ncbi:hypothetical protein IAR55_000452 [Kwoniella newhampshirensis]|uniref:Myb-like domain-containing protein n=1 Tax=Kwoniella newhampshirensis TaxID=1651941 RepID=A0AAW0Z6U7_9TREE